MMVKHPAALGLDPEGDLMRLTIRFHSEVRCSTRNLPPNASQFTMLRGPRTRAI